MTGFPKGGVDLKLAKPRSANAPNLSMPRSLSSSSELRYGIGNSNITLCDAADVRKKTVPGRHGQFQGAKPVRKRLATAASIPPWPGSESIDGPYQGTLTI
jgi:hypothetical protein